MSRFNLIAIGEQSKPTKLLSHSYRNDSKYKCAMVAAHAESLLGMNVHCRHKVMGMPYLNDVVYSVVVTLSDVDANSLEDHSVAAGSSLDGVCAGDHL